MTKFSKVTALAVSTYTLPRSIYPNNFNSPPSLIKNSRGLMKTSLLVLWGLWDPYREPEGQGAR
jgi:hypothetical protein